MTKVKSGSNANPITTIALYGLLIAALGTYFLPILSVSLPVFGRKSWSVQNLVKAVPKNMFQQQKEEKGKPLTPEYDFFDLVREISPRDPQTKTAVKVSPEFIAGALVPVALALA